MSVAVLKPRGKFDRMLARMEQQIVWEHVSESVRDDYADIGRMCDLAEQALRIGEHPDASATIKLRAITVSRECREAAHRIRKETFQDRTIPVLSHVDMSALMATLPSEVEESDKPREAGSVLDLVAELRRRGIDGIVRPVDVEFETVSENGDGNAAGG